MLFHTDRNLGIIRVLVFQLILTHLCRGQSELIGSSQPIVAPLGEDVILPCHLEPKRDAAGLTLEWTRPDLNPRFVHVWRSGEELVGTKHKSFEGRTSLFIDELKNGNISLKLSKVQISDEGTYRCFIPALDKQSFVQLVITSNAVSLPVITLAGTDESSSGVVLKCESEGWYPEPEVLWLDGEGNVLSAGPTETVRGPDDLYTVSSRVTVDKRHGNRFTCRVQQNIINWTRETHIHVSDDFFYVQSIIFPITVGLAVSLAVCFLIILSLGLILWKKHKIIRQWAENDNGQKKNGSKTRKTEAQVSTEEETEREQLMTDNTVQMDEFDGDNKNKHIKNRQTEVQQLKEDTQRMETNRETVIENKENNSTELDGSGADPAQTSCLVKLQVVSKQRFKEEKQRNQEAESKVQELKTERDNLEGNLKEEKQEREREVEKLKKQLEDKNKELEGNLKEEKQEREREVEKLKKQLEDKNKELERNQTDTKRQLQEEKQKREKAEREVKDLKNQLEDKNKELERNQTDTKRQLQEEKQKREKAEREVKDLKNQLEDKNKELQKYQTDTKRQLQEEKQRREKAEREVKDMKKQLDELDQLLAEYKQLKEEKQTSR
ncbi:butyrophilin-like protein 8 isoform X1 [Channa argus]|uniref:butyrophilin-like protein 8 isoform X1 n=1 Tax=Channa argus TaxID=215402 RepID=UPI00351FC56B